MAARLYAALGVKPCSHRRNSFTQRYQSTAIKLIEGGRMWDGTPGMLYVLCDTFAQPCQRLAILKSSGCSRCSGCDRSSRLPRFHRCCFGEKGCGFAMISVVLHILERHAPAGMRWDIFIEVNYQFKDELAYGRGSQHTFLRRYRNFRRCRRG